MEAFSRLIDDCALPQRFRPWVFTVAHRLCIDRIRRRARDRRHMLRMADPEPPPSPEQEAGRSERIRQLAAAVDGLSVTHRAAVLLHYGQGLGSREVTEILDLRHDLARSRVACACRLLRQRLEE